MFYFIIIVYSLKFTVVMFYRRKYVKSGSRDFNMSAKERKETPKNFDELSNFHRYRLHHYDASKKRLE